MQKGDEQPSLSRDGFYEYDESLPIHELHNRMKVFRKLCLGNKINTNNAFDIDMIGYFQSWLEKQHLSSKSEVQTFQEISDYLEASAKVYGVRVDSLSETTNKLIEGIKISNIITKLQVKSEVQKNDDKDELFKDLKPNRLKLMLTTADKLNDRPTGMNPAVEHHLSNFSVKDIFKSGRPSDHILALFNDTTVQNELNFTTTKKKDDEEIKTIEIYDFPDINWEKAAICTDFSDFEADKDQYNEAKEPDDLEFIEDYFDPNNQSVTSSMSNEVDDQKDDKSSANSNVKEDEPAIDGLLACIDSVKRDYSFFNPKLLANWNGPKAWKAQAMAKALKSKKERKELKSEVNLDSKTDYDDDIEPPKTQKSKIRSKDDDQYVKIEWLSKKNLKKRLENNFQSNEMILPRTLQNWNPINNITDSKMVVTDMKYRFTFLEYYSIEPEWWTLIKKEKKVVNEISSSLSTPTRMDNDSSDEINFQIFEPKNYDINDAEEHENANLPDSNLIESDGDLDSQDFTSETNIDIGDLKKEISQIIDEECVKMEPDSEWSSQLLFSNLLQKLKVRQALSVGIVYVSLLHLANERGLKCIQDCSIVNGRKDFYISRPLT